jgi:fatty-acyl-CoA synthase
VSHISTLIDAFRAAAEQARPQKGYTFIESSQSEFVSFQQLWQQATTSAGALQQLGVERGDRVLLVLPTGAEFARLYLATLLSGAAPCVLFDPKGTQQEAIGAQRVREIGDHLGARLLITTEKHLPLWPPQDLSFEVVTPQALQQQEGAPWRPVPVAGSDLALIQATSGSTETPKCVLLTHQNVLANLQQIGQRIRMHGEDVVVCWLPLFHDMGLIGCFLITLYWKLHGVFMSPYRFLRRPVEWLRTISHYGGTLSPAPNFAFALAARRISDKDLEGLDLSSWRSALCGAEPIDVRVLEEFVTRLAPNGFHPYALVPCYGMAEASLAVSMHHPGTAWRFEVISRQALVGQNRAVEVATSDAGALFISDCGPAMDGTRIEIRDPQGNRLADGEVGVIWIQGPSVTQGYHNLPERTAELIQDGWLNTGDMGYVRRGRIFVTGRAKDMIVVRGHNYLPTDFEWAAAEVSGVQEGRVVAFGVYDPASATEQIYMVVEQPRDKFAEEGETLQWRDLIKTHVARKTGLLPAHVDVVPRNTIPRTTSGKVQRGLTRSLYFQFHAPGAAHSASLQSAGD